jgi:glutaryl-CoA dehydrogenase
VPGALDLYDVDALLSDEQRLVRDSVARFVAGEAMPVIAECFAAQRFPAQLIGGLAELGVLGATVEGFGCAGLDAIAYGLICRELERADSSLRSFVSVQSSLVMGCIERFGSDEQRARWLEAMGQGREIGCFGLTESQGGSDPANMQTNAQRDGTDWRLRGSKLWITNGTLADVAVVWAKTEDGVAAFLVERGLAGFDSREIRDKFSLRASDTAALFFDDVRVPDRARLPGAVGLKAALSCLNDARYGIAWGAVGAAQACFAEALEYTGSRHLFGRPLAHTQLIQARLADIARRLTGAQLVAFRLGQLKSADGLRPEQISLAKWNNVRAALDIARECRDMLGAAGITAEHAAIRHMLNLESVATYEGTETVHQLIIGRALTGVPAF